MVRREYIPKASVNKNKLKREILEAMIDCAENIRSYCYEGAFGFVSEDSYVPPEEFKPGIADRFLFSEIIKENLERVLDIHCCSPLCGRMIGFGLMLEQYYPRYGTFRKMAAEEREKRCELFEEELKRYEKPEGALK